MKNLIHPIMKSIILAALFLLSGNINASISNSLKIEKEVDSKSLIVKFNVSHSEKVNIQLIDNFGVVMHKEDIIATNRFAKKYNLENLPSGIYNLVISDRTSKVVQPLQVFVADIEIDYSKQREIFKPAVRFKETYLDIDFIVFENADVKLELFDSAYETVYTKRFKDFGKVFGKRLNLKNLANGKYILKLSSGKEIYTEVIEVK